MDTDTALPDHVDVAIVGSGFAGLGMAIRLRQAGRTDFVVLERADDVGGTWQQNTYPGCQCDVPSNLYSFSFAPNAEWSQTFALQPEIWSYLRKVADDFGVRPYVRTGTAVDDAAWDEQGQRWRIETSRGRLTARVLVAGMGGLSEPSIPDIPGAETFAGPAFHTARWDHDADLAGKRVAVIGTGASAVQVVPRLQPQVEQLTLFQRTPPWIMPHPGRSVRPRERALFRALPPLQRLVRGAVYWGRETFVLPFRFHRLSRVPERMARAHLEQQVADPLLRDKLTPRYEIGCKRILMSNEYFPALQQPNAELVTDAIAEITPRSVVTADGVEHPADAIVWGTGFHVTDMPYVEWLRGRDGRVLGDVWRERGMQGLRGTTVAGFPNLFMLVGPNTGLGHNSIVFMIESQIAYVLDALRALDARGATALDTRPSAQAAFNETLQRRMRGTVWTQGGCASWYLDAHGRNTTLWPGTSWSFRRATRRFDPAEHELLPPLPASATVLAEVY
ncbi:MAG TPA: NAD(P)/FAD-dependent oxidoreductase [Conexibacter sp.]|jgi:cation diffusion facilitator CzcD-associated flavoprotein CzcO|nr:NAD(P)/FAD-dependent oxidoreductase [Conexibacter sp.]